MAHPRSVQEILDNVTARKDGLRKALTVDVDRFYHECDPDKDNLCLYGEPDGSWALDLPAEEVPAELPEPCLGINFARDGMARKEWLALVAVHSDAWIMSVAFYYGAKLNFEQRKSLFNQMNSSSTLFEVVTGKREAVGLKRGRQNMSVKRKMVTDGDISTNLKGCRAELYWPDDGNWYSVVINAVNVKKRMATIQYDTGEIEELDLTEVIHDEQMYLLE
uniref:Alfin-like protein n=1 Tax=Ulva partita TaxID=1605170 RepID=A0A1C9ZPI2_9CHLO|nr:alfin-like protein [Ulva partita]